MISDDDKLIVCKTLDNCWWLNLNAQIKCQEIFQSLNRIWNSMHVRIEGREVSSDDSVKFRKLMQVILDGERIVEFSHLSTLEDLAQFSPLIHNDSILVQPHNPSIDEELPKALSERATQAHLEFRKYLSRVKENPNSANRREFRNRLCRFLYVIRSNIVHGSKSNYEGSQRNENLCVIVYSILIQICNLILDAGLYKIAAYGELKRDGRLYTPLVENNGGTFLEKGTINGELLKVDNTLLFNREGEYSSISADILQFSDFKSLNHIDLVECMPRVFLPYFDETGVLKGFAWVYTSSLNVRNLSDSISVSERRIKIAEKANVFLYALYTIENKFKQTRYENTKNDMKIFGGLTIKYGKQIKFDNADGESLLITPHANELISFIDEIQRKYVAIFDYSANLMPYSKMLTSGIDCVYFENKKFFKSYPKGKNDPDAEFIFKDIVEMVSQRVADWMCDRIGDEDSIQWDELKKFHI